MKAVWQLVDSIIIPRLTYGAEGWEPSKTELQQLQTIMNKALKTLLFLPQQTPTSILLQETGYLPIERVIKKKRVMQAHRTLYKKDPSLNKSMTTTENSLWRAATKEILEEYNLTEESLHISKQGLSKAMETLNWEITNKEIMEEASSKTKTKHWMDNKRKLQKIGRPEYMTKLSKKQCNALMKVGSSMTPCKIIQKNQYKGNLECRFCYAHQETQKHVITECVSNPHRMNIPYEELFSDENCERLKEAAEKIIKTIETTETKK